MNPLNTYTYMTIPDFFYFELFGPKADNLHWIAVSINYVDNDNFEKTFNGIQTQTFLLQSLKFLRGLKQISRRPNN